MANLLFSLTARTDLELIWRYSADDWGELRAETYLRTIFNATEQIQEHPNLGRMRDDVRVGYRSVIVGSHVIFYKLIKNRVNIIRVLHQRVDIAAIF